MTDPSQGMPHRKEVQDLLVEQMRHDLSRPVWWKTLWARLTLAGGILAIAGAGVAGVMLLDERPVYDTGIVHCLEGPYRNPDGSLSGASASVATPEGVVAINDAEAMCALMWESGGFADNDELSATPTPGIAPTEFTTCVTDEGEAAVVPGRIECSVLRLHPFDSE